MKKNKEETTEEGNEINSKVFMSKKKMLTKSMTKLFERYLYFPLGLFRIPSVHKMVKQSAANVAKFLTCV